MSPKLKPSHPVTRCAHMHGNPTSGFARPPGISPWLLSEDVFPGVMKSTLALATGAGAQSALCARSVLLRLHHNPSRIYTLGVIRRHHASTASWDNGAREPYPSRHHLNNRLRHPSTSSVTIRTGRMQVTGWSSLIHVPHPQPPSPFFYSFLD